MKQNNKNKWLMIATLGIGMAGLSSTAATANGLAHMKIGGRTSQPIGHYEYCQRQAKDCKLVSHNINPVKLTRARWDEIVKANARANNSVIPVTDLEYYGQEEYWTLPGKYGDCEDYALMKRKELMSKGWPASSLLVTVVRQPNGDGHAVLTVRTNRADYILDNLDDRIKQWNKTDYTYLKRQAAAHSGQWEKIIDTRAFVGSVK